MRQISTTMLENSANNVCASIVNYILAVRIHTVLLGLVRKVGMTFSIRSVYTVHCTLLVPVPSDRLALVREGRERAAADEDAAAVGVRVALLGGALALRGRVRERLDDRHAC